MEVAFRLVDVFTETPFLGNRLCVVTETPPGLSEARMRMLALETNFSETTFVTETAPEGYRMRIFTPQEELPFAGHPTLGTAFVLARDGKIGSSALQTTAVGEVPIEVPVEVDLDGGFAWMTQRPPAFRPEFGDRTFVAEATGLRREDFHPEWPMQVISTGLGPLLVPLRDEEALRRAELHAAACARATAASGGECLYLFAVRGDGDVMARMFDASLGVGEDPATGSAAGPLGVYLAARGLAGLPGRAVIAQGELVGRPSFLHVDVRPHGDSWTVRVGGGVRIVGDGRFRIGD
jgi:trans-2,3-dihydro-3-hydroxyanthranilate isomerase